MKTTIKYKVLFYDGKKGKIKVDYDCPDFTDEEIEPLVLNGKKVSDGHTYTIEQQIDEWVNEFDKKDWMEDNDVMMIFDWKVVSAKAESALQTNLVVKPQKLSQSEMVGLYVQMAPMSEELKTEFIAVYAEIKPAIEKLPFDKQIDITFKGLGVGFKAAQEAYRYLTDYQKALNQIDSKSWVTTTNGRTTYDKDKLRELAREITLKQIDDENIRTELQA